MNRRLLITVLTPLLASVPPAAKAEGHHGKDQKKLGPATTSLQEYLAQIHAAGVETPSTTGSLWVSNGLLSEAASDYKARLAGDLIIVRLIDSFTANTSGETQTSRKFSTQSQVTGLLGQVKSGNALQNLFDANSATSLDGKGSSTMASNLQVSLAGHVVEVMPNGVMVVEATRDFTVGNDRQTMTLRGLVRPGDVATDGSVLSSQMGDLQLEIKGKGAVADVMSRPNILIRTLLKILSF